MLLSRCVLTDELISALHQRFGAEFSIPLTVNVAQQLGTGDRNALQQLQPEQREKEETQRVARQRILIRGAVELAIMAISGPPKDNQSASSICESGAEWFYSILRELVRDF